MALNDKSVGQKIRDFRKMNHMTQVKFSERMHMTQQTLSRYETGRNPVPNCQTAEQERITIKKRQRQGMDAAKRKGKHLGRPFREKPPHFDEVVQMWKANEISTIGASRRLGLSKTMFYTLMKRQETVDSQEETAGS